MPRMYRAAIAVVLVAGCLFGNAHAASQPIAIVDFAFQPATATEEVGVPITWTNTGSFGHTVTFDTVAIDSGVISPNDTFSASLPNAGTYTYHCNIHPNMVGTVVVQAAPKLPPRVWLPIVQSS